MTGENLKLPETDGRRTKLYRSGEGMIVHLYSEGMDPFNFEPTFHCWLPGDSEGKALFMTGGSLEPLTEDEARAFRAKMRAALPDLQGYLEPQVA